MTLITNTSAIPEIRNQLSLDFADGENLNVVGSNLGINRPPFGFSDPVWRAIVKELAVEYKQIPNKFRDILAILFGPYKTQVSSLAQDAGAGSTLIYLNNTDNFPQVGTLIIDGGLLTEETIEYELIDRRSNAVYLATGLTYHHRSRDFDSEKLLIFSNTSTAYLGVSSSVFFPTTNYPYPVVVGRGTSAEETAIVIDNDVDTGVLTLQSPLSNAQSNARVSSVFDSTSRDYATSSLVLVANDVSKFPNTGVLILGAVGTFTATGGSSTTVTVAANTFTADRQVSNVVVFDGNVTAALARIEARVTINTDSTLTFFEALPATPAAGDTFSVRAVAEYTELDVDVNSFVLKKSIEDLPIVTGTKIENLVGSTVSLATVKCLGTGWDIIQSQPRLVELLIPDHINDVQDLRSASYIHGELISPTPATTVATQTQIGDTILEVADTSDFPTVGVIAIDSAGVNERLGYYVVSSTELAIATMDISNVHLVGATVELYQPAYASTDLLIGDYYTTDDTFPGPYVYDLESDAPTGTVALTSLNQLLPGKTRVSIFQEPGNTALELENASSFDLGNFPYQLLVGDRTGNRELLTVTDVNLKQRVSATVVNNESPGITSLEVTSVTAGAAADAANFPNAAGYRVIIGRGTANAEVCYVVSIDTGSDLLNFKYPTINSHSIGETVQLMSDVVTVDPITDTHIGRLDSTHRASSLNINAIWPTSTDLLERSAELTNALITDLAVVDGSNFDPSGGTILLNFGNGLIKQQGVVVAASGTTVEVTDSSVFPTTYPYVIIVGKGSFNEETVLVTDNNTGTNELTINDSSYSLVNSHAAGEIVEWIPGDPEVLDYSSVSGNIISFSSGVVLQFTHSPTENVIDSSSISVPSEFGYDFPLRMPSDVIVRLQYLIDLIRAAGVQVNIISAR